MIALSDYKFIHQLRKLARLHWPILAKYLKVDLKELNLWASGKEIPEVYKLQVQQLVLDLEKLSYDDRCKKVIELLGPELHKEQIVLRKHQNEQLDKRYSSFPIYGTGPMIDDGSVHKEIGIVRIAKSVRVNVKEKL